MHLVKIHALSKIHALITSTNQMQTQPPQHLPSSFRQIMGQKSSLKNFLSIAMSQVQYIYYTCIRGLFDWPVGWNPSWEQKTLASKVSHSLSHTVPQTPLTQTSTRPEMGLLPPANLTSPCKQLSLGVPSAAWWRNRQVSVSELPEANQSGTRYCTATQYNYNCYYCMSHESIISYILYLLSASQARVHSESPWQTTATTS